MGFEPGWAWLIGGLLLAAAEIMAPGVFLLWLGGAAAATGLVALAVDIPLAAQFGLFAAFALLSVVAGRHLADRNPILSDDPLLNEGVARLIGRVVTVVEAIEGGEGRVRVGDGVWTACGPDAPVGAKVEIVGARGSRLKVEAVPAPERLSGPL